MTGGNYATIAGDGAFTILASTAPTVRRLGDGLAGGRGDGDGGGGVPGGFDGDAAGVGERGVGVRAGWRTEERQGARERHVHLHGDGGPVAGGELRAGVHGDDHELAQLRRDDHRRGDVRAGLERDGGGGGGTGFVFWAWTEGGSPVSTNATYTFAAAGSRSLVASFMHAPNATTFDFDNAGRYRPLPITLSSDGLAATFTGGYSVQQVGELGVPAGVLGAVPLPQQRVRGGPDHRL